MEADLVPVCDAVLMAGNGCAIRFGASRGWVHEWVYPNFSRASRLKAEVSKPMVQFASSGNS